MKRTLLVWGCALGFVGSAQAASVSDAALCSPQQFAGKAAVNNQTYHGIYTINSSGVVRFLGVPESSPTKVFRAGTSIYTLKYRGSALAGYSLSYSTKSRMKETDFITLGDNESLHTAYCGELGQMTAKNTSGLISSYNVLCAKPDDAPPAELSKQILDRAVARTGWQKDDRHFCEGFPSREAAQAQLIPAYEDIYNGKIRGLVTQSEACVRVARDWCQAPEERIQALTVPDAKVQLDAKKQPVLNVSCRGTVATKVLTKYAGITCVNNQGQPAVAGFVPPIPAGVGRR